MRRGPGWRTIAQTIALLVLTASVVSGVRAIVLDLQLAFRYAPPSVFPPSFPEQIDRIVRTVPAGEPLLYVSAEPEEWYSRMWQRALYPRNPVIVAPASRDGARIRRLAAEYGARFLLCSGDPPPDPGFRWSIALGSLPGLPGQIWLGRVRP